MKRLFLMCFLSLGLVFSGQSLFAESTGRGGMKPRRNNPNRPKTTTGNKKKTPKKANRKPAGRNGASRKAGAGKKGRKPRASTTAPAESTAGGNGFSAYKIEVKVILKDGGKILRGVIIVEGPRAIELIISGKSINIPRDSIVKIIPVTEKIKEKSEENSEEKSEKKGEDKVFVSSYELKDYVLEKDVEGLLVVVSEGEREKVTPKGSGRGSGAFGLGDTKKMMDALKKLSPADRKKLLEAAKKHLSDTSTRNPKGSIPDSLKGLLKW